MDVTQFAGICLRVNKEVIDMLNIRLKTDIDTMSSELQLSDYLPDKIQKLHGLQLLCCSLTLSKVYIK